jgi:hypothetical protein
VAAPFNSTVADLTFYSSLAAPTQRAFVVRGHGCCFLAWLFQLERCPLHALHVA